MGRWIGDSICQVKNSPCHDEKAVYQIFKSQQGGKFTIDLGKVVNGEAESMVVLDFEYDVTAKTLACTYDHGTWEFTVSGNQMVGTLTTPDKVVYRRVHLQKDEL
ncbi:hypothetical protein HUU05_15360 [candidate division KSB1 bacterium]|nr:hypothetical protein [candidate division KSB1 bacterium]